MSDGQPPEPPLPLLFQLLGNSFPPSTPPFSAQNIEINFGAGFPVIEPITGAGSHPGILNLLSNINDLIANPAGLELSAETIFTEGYHTPEDGDFWEPVCVRIPEEELSSYVDRRRVTDSLRKEIAEKEGEEINCPICQEEMKTNQHVFKTKCGHVFHQKCLKEWLVEKCERPTCPMCKTDVRE